MHQNAFTLMGTVASEVVRSTTRDGLVLARFRICIAGPARPPGGAVEATYMGVTCWRRLAENVASCLSRGDPVIVTGRLRSRTLRRSGRPVKTIEVEAAAVGHDLSRVRRPAGVA
jgi:single-strand DNA-binding protein